MGSLGRPWTLNVRLAADRREIRKAQRLQYKFSSEKGGAIPDARTAFARHGE